MVPQKGEVADEPRGHECLQPGNAGSDLRPDPHLDRQPGEDPFLVVRRNQEAGDDQLPHLQAGARRAVLRPHLRAGEGLRVPVRQVQADEVQGHHLRKVRRGSHTVEGPARAHGPYRTGGTCRPYLVPQVAAEPHLHAARHDAEGCRTHPVFRELHRARARPDADEAASAAVGERVHQGAGRLWRGRLHRVDRRRSHPRHPDGHQS